MLWFGTKVIGSFYSTWSSITFLNLSDVGLLSSNILPKSLHFQLFFFVWGDIVIEKMRYLLNSNRLAGAVLIAPVINYWWSGLPANLSNEAFNKKPMQDRWALRVAHYTPWLTYWWNTQRWFPASSLIAHNLDVLSPNDKTLIPKLSFRKDYMVCNLFSHSKQHIRSAIGSFAVSLPIVTKQPKIFLENVLSNFSMWFCRLKLDNKANMDLSIRTWILDIEAGSSVLWT